MTTSKSMLLCMVLHIFATYAEDATSNIFYNPYRIQNPVKPTEYKIKITPNMTERMFDGVVEMKFKAENSEIDRITLHSKLIENIVVDKSVSTVDVMDPTFNLMYELMDFMLSGDNLTVGTEYVLRLTYTGKIQTDMDGFYSSSYEQNNIKKYIGTTMSFPTNARSIFPCLDEPGFKAKYEITIDCPEGFNCISNMKELENIDGMVKFHPTPLMSSYLITFIVSDFVPAEMINEPRQFRIWTRPEARTMGKYAFDIGQKLVDNMSNFTGINYFEMDENMKMDHVAIPDFPAGAMENWGIITYREDNLLFDPNHSSVKNRQRVASVVAHEIAHMWFGDLATYDWFYCPWMSEAFGRFFEYFLTESAEEFGMEDQFIGAQVHTAMIADATINALPMTYPFINSQGEILAHFGTISYNKGATILRMVQHWIGHTDFQNGLRAYLNQYAYKTAVPDQLFDALDNNTDVRIYNTTVKKLMTEWTTRSGYPVLTVSIIPNSGRILTSQDRYTHDVITGDLYPIPITYTSESVNNFENTKPAFIQETYEHTMERPDQGWIVYNIQQTGFYRVRYGDELLYKLIKALNGDARTSIHRYNRAQIVDDAINLARNNYISIGRMMDTIQFLEHETDFAPWSDALVGFNFLRLHFGRRVGMNETAKDFDFHIANLMVKVVDHVQDVSQEDANLLRLLHTNTMVFSCNLGNINCIGNSTMSYQSLKSDSIEVAPDSREYVYCNGLRHGNAEDFDFLWQRFLDHNVPSEKSVILGALGCTRDDDKLKEFLMRTIEDDSKIREQDRMQAYNSALVGNPENAEKTFLFIVENLHKIIEVYGSGVTSLLNSLSGRMTEHELGRLEAFVDSTNELTALQKEIVKQTISKDRRLVLRMASKSDELLAWIDNKYNSAASLSQSFILISAMILGFLTRSQL